MARPVNTKVTGKGELKNGRRHLNASLPQQLVFDFNEVAKTEGLGRRDAIVEGLIRRFLESVAPSSKSLREAPSSEFVEQIRAATFAKREAARLREQVANQEAIHLSRKHALEIVEVTASFLTRKPPRRALRRSPRKEKAS